MRKITQNLIMILMMAILAIAVNAAFNDKRITLKNGKAKDTVSLNPSRTYRLLISNKEFTKLQLQIQTKGKIKVTIKTPKGKILTSGMTKSFTIKQPKKIEQGDYQIILENVGDKLAAVGIKVGDVKGEST